MADLHFFKSHFYNLRDTESRTSRGFEVHLQKLRANYKNLCEQKS